MKKTSRIIAFILLIALLFTGMGMTYKNVVKNVNLGLDLQGGFEVLFQVDPLNKGDKIDKSTSSYISNIRKSCKCSRCIRTENKSKIQIEFVYN